MVKHKSSWLQKLWKHNDVRAETVLGFVQILNLLWLLIKNTTVMQ